MVDRSPVPPANQTQINADQLPILDWLPVDGSWRTENPALSRALYDLSQQPAATVQFRNRDGIRQFRLTPNGISQLQRLTAAEQDKHQKADSEKAEAESSAP